MANKAYSETAIQDIADAIREKNGSTDTYTVAQMGAAVRSLSSGGGGGYQSGDVVKAWQSTDMTVASGYSSVSVQYGTAVVNTDGVLSLGGTTGTLSISSVDSLATLKGKYCIPKTSSYGTTATDIYWIPEDATFTSSGSTTKTYKVDKANKMFVLA